MEIFRKGIIEALGLIISLDPEVVEISLLSLIVSGMAVMLAALAAIPLGTLLMLKRRFFGREFLVALINTFMGLPPVVVGLVVVLLLARTGPLGSLHLLYTVSGMIIAQFCIALPIIAGLTLSALEALDPGFRVQIMALGASPFQLARALAWQARRGLVAAVIAGFGRCVAEVGAVMMVGGNIRHETRVLTTATVLEARQGRYDRAIALGMILLLTAFAVNILLTRYQQQAGGGR